MLVASPPEQKKTLLHLVIEKILLKGREIKQVVLAFTEKIQAELEAYAPTAETAAAGVFSMGRHLKKTNCYRAGRGRE